MGQTSHITLVQHVVESNKIESYTDVKQDDPLFTSHLAAAERVAGGEILSCQDIHRILMTDVDDFGGIPGEYRETQVAVISGHLRKMMPRKVFVKALMSDFQGRLETFLVTETLNDEWLAKALHHHFLCIHPFADGNGRTARLLWNMLRVQKGLPWEIVQAESKSTYFGEIQNYEEEIFVKEFPGAYSDPQD